MMNGDDMLMFVALLLVMSLLDMVLTMKWYARTLNDPLANPTLSRAVFAATLVGVVAASGLLVYDVSTAGPGYRTILEAVAIMGFGMGSLLAKRSMGVDDAKRR